MKWKVKAGCLVDEGWISWEVDADSAEEAENKGYLLARNSNVADCGNVEIEPLEEDKQLILDALLKVLELTRNRYDVIDLQYDEEKGTVTALFGSGATKIANVAGDSGTAMIRDVIYQII